MADEGEVPDPELVAMVEWVSETCGAARLPPSILLGAGLLRARVTDTDVAEARSRFDALMRERFGDDHAAACQTIVGLMTTAG